MKYLVVLLFSNLFFFGSCSGLKNNINTTDQVILNSSNYKLLDGTYESKSVSRKEDLYWYAFEGVMNYQSQADSTGSITFKVIDKKHIEVSYIKTGTVVKSKIIKGKIKNGYFILNRKYLFIPMFFTNLYRDRVFRIGLLENGNIITDYNLVSFGTAMIIFPFRENTREYNVEFKRIENESD